MDWYMKNYRIVDQVINDIIGDLNTQLYLPTHTKTTFFIDYDNVIDELIEYMYKTSNLR